MSSAPHILVVDDHDDVRTLVRMVLESAGFRVTDVPGGRQARKAIADERPDVVLLDVQMPEEDGWVVLSRLRAEPETQELPVVMCTVKAHQEDIDRAYKAGCNGYIVKPFDVD